MAVIHLPSLVQKIKVDTKEMRLAELQAKRFGREMQKHMRETRKASDEMSDAWREQARQFREMEETFKRSTKVRKEHTDVISKMADGYERVNDELKELRREASRRMPEVDDIIAKVDVDTREAERDLNRLGDPRQMGWQRKISQSLHDTLRETVREVEANLPVRAHGDKIRDALNRDIKELERRINSLGVGMTAKETKDLERELRQKIDRLNRYVERHPLELHWGFNLQPEEVERRRLLERDRDVLPAPRQYAPDINWARIFGRGSRNNFLHLLGGVVAAVEAVPKILMKAFSGLKEVFEDVGRTFIALRKLGVGFGPALLRSFAGVGPVVAGFIASLGLILVVASKVIPAVAALFSMLIGSITAVIGAISVGLAGALLALVPIAVAALGAIGPIVALMRHLSNDTPKVAKAFEPLKKAFEDFDKKTEDMAANMARQLSKFAPLIENKVIPSIVKAGDALSQHFLGRLAGLFTGDWHGEEGVPKPGKGVMDKFLKQWGDSTLRMLEDLGHAFAELSGGLVAFFAPALPYAERITSALEDAFTTFRDWSMSARGQKEIANFFEVAWDNAEKLWGSIVNIAKALGQIFFDTAEGPGRDFLGWLEETTAKWNDWLGDPKNQETISNFWDDVGEFMRTVKDLGKSVWDWFDDLDTEQAREDLNDLLNVVKTVVGWLETLAGWFETISSAWDSAVGWVNGLGQAFEDMKEMGPDKGFSRLFEAFGLKEDMAKEWGRKVWEAFRNGIVDSFTNMRNLGIDGVINTLFEKIGIKEDMAKEWGRKIWNSFKNGIITFFGNIADLGVDGVINKLFRAMGIKEDSGKEWASQVIENFKTGVQEKWNAFLEWIGGGWVEDLFQAFGIEEDSGKEWGKQIIDGFWNGISEKWEEVKQWASDLWNGFIDTVKSIFGIQSPSTVFKSIGTDIIQGLWDGVKGLWDSFTGWLWEQFEKLPEPLKWLLRNITGAVTDAGSTAQTEAQSSSSWGGVVPAIAGLFTNNYGAFAGGLASMVGAVNSSGEEAKGKSKTLWGSVRDFISGSMSSAKTNAVARAAELARDIGMYFLTGKLNAEKQMKGVPSTVSSNLGSAATIAAQKTSSIASTILSKFRESASSAQTQMGNVKKNVDTKMSESQQRTAFHLKAMNTAMTISLGALAVIASTKFQNVVNAIKTKMGNAVSAARSAMSQVQGAFSGAGNWLYSAGQRIINGLVAGIQSMIGRVRSTLSGLTASIPNWKGPRERDLKLLVPAGQHVMTGFREGLRSEFPRVQADLERLTNRLSMTALNSIVPMYAAEADWAGGRGGFVGGMAPGGSDEEIPSKVVELTVNQYNPVTREDSEMLVRAVDSLAALGFFG